MKRKSIKKIITSLLCFSIVSVLLVNSVSVLAVGNNILEDSSIANKNSNSIQDNTIRINTIRNGDTSNQFFTDFGFSKNADGTYRFRNKQNGIFNDSSQINIGDTLYTNTMFTFRNSNGEVYESHSFHSGMKLFFIAQILQQIIIKESDSIQIINNDKSEKQVEIGGNVNNNLTETDYSYGLSSFNSNNFKFTIKQDGLYAEYINQNIIPDGNYMIESVQSPNKFVTIVPGKDSVEASDRGDLYEEKQFNITYDNVKKVYRIKNLYTNDYLTWNSSHNNDVIHFGTGIYFDQLWYLKKQSGTNIYSFVNAHNLDRFLNLDSDKINISVASERNNNSQKFKLIKLD